MSQTMSLENALGSDQPTSPPSIPPVATSPVTGRLESIDVVRGLACAWVLLHHGLTVWHYRIRAPIIWHVMDFARIGYLGVHLFLVISGFVLFYPVVRRHGLNKVKTPTGTFLYRRCRRILPPYYAALIICIAIQFCTGQLDNAPKNYLYHLTMFFNLDPNTITRFNGAFWSLALEFQLYLTFPFLLWLCRTGSIWAVLGVTLTTSVIWQDLVVRHLLGPIPLVEGQIIWPYLAHRWYALPGRWFEFAAGMAAAAAVMQPRWWKLAIAAGLIVVIMPIAGRLVLERDGQFGPARDQLWGVVFASLLVLASAIPARIVESLPARVLAWFGGISYSIYLIHEPFLSLTRRILDQHDISGANRFIAFVFIALPVIMVIGYVFHLLFERPFMSVSQRKLADPELPASSMRTR